MAVDAKAIARLNPDVFHAMPSDSQTAIVVFSAKVGAKRRFNFIELLAPLADLTKLFVRDPSDRWYNAELPGAGESVDEIARTLERVLADLGATRVITCGSSMGGYAAILFGCMIGAERAITIAPQTLLDPTLPFTPPPDVDLRSADLAPVIHAHPGTQIELVVGWDCLVDIFQARRVARYPSVRVLAIPRAGHLCARDLNRAGKLLPLVDGLLDGRVLDVCGVDPELDVEVEPRIEDAVYAAGRREWLRAVESIAPVAERRPDWAGPGFHHGRALANLGDLAGAETALSRALRANSGWVELRAELARVLLEQDRLPEAEVQIREGLAHDASWWRGHVILAECLLRQGRADEGLAGLREIEKELEDGLSEYPRWALGRLALRLVLRQKDDVERGLRDQR